MKKFRNVFDDWWPDPMMALGMLGGGSDVTWYLDSGISPSDVVAVYDPISATSLANSYKNVHNPSMHEAVVGNLPPSWQPGLGWLGEKATQYLITDIVAANGWSAIGRFENCIADVNKTMFGSYGGNSTYFILQPKVVGANNHYYLNGGLSAGIVPRLSSGVMAIAGQSGYLNGSLETSTIGNWSGTNTRPIYLMCYNDQGNPAIPLIGYFVGLALYRSILTPTQVSKVCDRLAAKPFGSILPSITGEQVTLPRNLGFGTPQQTPAIMIHFDDENIGQYTYALPKLLEHNAVATSYVSYDFLGGTHYNYNCTTIGQLLELQAAGWIIGNHCQAEQAVIGHSVATDEGYIGGNTVRLDTRVFPYIGKHFAFPGGEGFYDANGVTALQNLGFQTARSFRTTWEEFCPPVNGNLKIGCSGNNFQITTTTTLNDLKAMVDACKINKNVTTFLFHEIAPTPASGFDYSTTPEIFNGLIDYIASQGVQCISIDEYYRLQSSDVVVRRTI